jgi:hypothetical protein
LSTTPATFRAYAVDSLTALISASFCTVPSTFVANSPCWLTSAPDSDARSAVNAPMRACVTPAAIARAFHSPLANDSATWPAS